MSDLDEIARKRKMFERYPVFFAAGLVIIVLSLVLMGWRELNEQALQTQVYAGQGPPSPSQAYLDAARLEQVLHHIIEQLIFVGLAALKLAIGFSIAVIALHLKETGLKGVGAFHKAGVVSGVPAMNEPWFTRFPKILIAGFAVIFASIVRYFTTIVGFVRGRKAIVTEGVSAIVTVLGSGGVAPVAHAGSVAPSAGETRADSEAAP